MKLWTNLKTRSDRKSILNAFPKSLRREVEKVIEILPIANHNIILIDGAAHNVGDLISAKAQTVFVNSEMLKIPYRIYLNEPEIAIETGLSDLQKTILNCIYLRHHNGFVRQRRLENLINNTNYFIIPFAFQLLGEYVIEILKVLKKHINPLTIDNYAKFILENEKYWNQTENRMLTYWDLYYRPSIIINSKEKKEARKNYVGQQIVETLKKGMYNTNFGSNTMKVLSFLVIIISLSCSGNKTEKASLVSLIDTIQVKNNTFTINCTPPDVESLIVRSDTTFRMENYNGHTIKSFDLKGRLVRFIKTNLFESNSNNIYSFATFYDSVGHIIYEDKVKGFNSKWHCYSYQYNKQGHLIMKSGYSSGEIGVKITYVYNGEHLEKEIVERADGKKEIQH